MRCLHLQNTVDSPKPSHSCIQYDFWGFCVSKSTIYNQPTNQPYTVSTMTSSSFSKASIHRLWRWSSCTTLLNLALPTWKMDTGAPSNVRRAQGFTMASFETFSKKYWHKNPTKGWNVSKLVESYYRDCSRRTLEWLDVWRISQICWSLLKQRSPVFVRPPKSNSFMWQNIWHYHQTVSLEIQRLLFGMTAYNNTHTVHKISYDVILKRTKFIASLAKLPSWQLTPPHPIWKMLFCFCFSSLEDIHSRHVTKSCLKFVYQQSFQPVTVL